MTSYVRYNRKRFATEERGKRDEPSEKESMPVYAMRMVVMVMEMETVMVMMMI